MRKESDKSDAEIAYARYGLPALGLRNYWYPVVASRKLGRKPRRATVLGETIVLFRARGGRVFALADRCLHRGASLSQGTCHYSGTISCAYHGWTFDGETGNLVAALMEGPNSPIANRLRIRSYPAEERFGLIWLFIGDMEPVDFLGDLPEMLRSDDFFKITWAQDYRCNWRALADNWTNDHHGPYVHRNSPELVFQPFMRFAFDLDVVLSADGRAIGVRGKNGISGAAFPGLGRFPRRTWHRVLPPIGRGNRDNFATSEAARQFGFSTPTQTRLPSMVIVARQNAQYFLIQWGVPLDARTTRLFNINCFRRAGWPRALYDRANYALWRSWAHDWIFSDQDRHVLEGLIPGPERLSKTDVGVIAWRRFAAANARRPPGFAARQQAAPARADHPVSP